MGTVSSIRQSPSALNKDLFAKYMQVDSGYFSCPGIPAFTDEFTREAYSREVEREPKQSTAPLSLYIHIPFCEKLCHFCSCNKVITSDHAVARRYLDYLAKEIHLQSELIGPYRQVMALRLGGGTPTFLDGAELTELMYLLASHFKLNDQGSREYTIEIDPRTVNKYTLPLLKGLGFNHLHFGMQDFDATVQKAIHRVQQYNLIEKLSTALRHYQFASVTFDMVYGLPSQTLQSLTASLDKLVQLSPDRVIYYGYQHQPAQHKGQAGFDSQLIPSVAAKQEMFSLITDKLTQAGYQYVGLDLFVKPSDPLAVAQREGRLNRGIQGYSVTESSEMIGMGVSAISSLNHAYAQNESSLADYYHSLDENKLPIREGVTLSTDDEIRRDVVKKLVCDYELDTSAIAAAWELSFTDYFSKEIVALKPMEKDGLIEWQGATLRATRRGRTILSSICTVFDKYYQGVP